MSTSYSRLMRPTSGICVLLGFLLLPGVALGQVATTAASYFDGVTSAVGNGGGYGASVPLNLPGARGGLPVPVGVNYGGNRVGAAGKGWEVALSYIYHDTTTAHRRPSPALQSVDRLSVVLNGATIRLIRNSAGTAWVAAHGATQIEVRQLSGDPDTLQVFDGEGHTYTFSNQGASAGSHLANGNFFLLKSVSGSGINNVVKLNYDITTPALPGGGSGLAINLTKLQYNAHPTTADCYKSEVVLSYDTPANAPLAMSALGTTVLARFTKLTTVAVNSYATCVDAATHLRTYHFTYQADADTQEPRLLKVTETGQQGTAEETVTLPVAVYHYGTVSDGGKLTYTKASVSPFTGDALTSLSGKSFSTTAMLGDREIDTHRDFSDINGDGRPDLLRELILAGEFNDGSEFANKAGADATTVLEKRSQIAVQPRREKRSVTVTTPFFGLSDIQIDGLADYADVNGDGRPDYIVADSGNPQLWKVRLNTPDPSDPLVPSWKDINVSVANLRAALTDAGFSLPTDYTPLSRQTTAHDKQYTHCWSWTGIDWQRAAGGWGRTPCDAAHTPIQYDDPGTLSPPYAFGARGAQTVTEWKLQDVNGDGYPDLVFDSAPVTGPSDVLPKPSFFGTSVGQLAFANGLGPVDIGGTQQVLALINTAGVHLEASGAVFSDTVKTLINGTSTALSGAPDHCGIERWKPLNPSGDPTNVPFEDKVCGFVDVNGDGIVDRVTTDSSGGSPTAFLGTGDLSQPYAPASFALPDTIEQTHNLAHRQSGTLVSCENGDFYPAQVLHGYRDINGDGLLDYVAGTLGSDQFPSATGWSVRLGTGSGFGPALAVNSPVGLVLSNTTNACDIAKVAAADGDVTAVTAGLYDIDGDGQPEAVVKGAQAWDIYQLAAIQQPDVGPVASRPYAGRLVAIDNGYGAVTRVGYKSAKEDTKTLHLVPSTEIVATAVRTTFGNVSLLAETVHYAYGNVSLYFDAVADTFVSTGYQRSVVLQRTIDAATDEPQGIATVTDSFGLTPFSASMDEAARLKRYALVGSVHDVTVFAGTEGTDPWALLNADNNFGSGRISGRHYDWNARLLPAGGKTDPDNETCVDMMFPYDYAQSTNTTNTLGTDLCTQRGFLFHASSVSWRGQPGHSSDPAASANAVATRTDVLAIDDQQRVTQERNYNDLNVADTDDVCVYTDYAAPTGTDRLPRVLNAVAATTVTAVDTGTHACKVKTAALAHSSWTYDGLAPGSVSNGFVTASTVSRLDEQGRPINDANGQSDIQTVSVTYDPQGNPVGASTTRDDGSDRSVSTTYEDFKLASTELEVNAEDVDGNAVPTQTTKIERDPVTLLATHVTAPNGEKSGASYDGFGRVKLSKVTPVGGTEGVLSSLKYFGFAESETSGRSVEQKVFTDKVAEADVDSAAGRVGTTYLDNLGRPLSTEVNLGADYDNQIMVIGSRVYDLEGRVVFAADPHPSTESETTAYGTTYDFNADGTLRAAIRGRGPQPINTADIPCPYATNESNETYPTCLSINYESYSADQFVLDPASLLSGSPQANVSRLTRLDALGRVRLAQTSGPAGTLELKTFGYDVLGRLTNLTRYKDPANKANPVTTAWHYDSLGQVVELDEPGNAPQFRSYDTWGELTDTHWTDGAIEKHSSSQYDALGRLLHSEDRNGQVTIPETVSDFVYDSAFSSTAPAITATNVLGRLAKASSPTSSVFFSYDGLGRASAQVYTDLTTSPNDRYAQTSNYHDDGSLAQLHLLQPDDAFADERVDYAYDSAGRARMVDYTAGSYSKNLFTAAAGTTGIDLFGRLRQASFSGATFTAAYADTGRKLIGSVLVTASNLAQKRIAFAPLAGTSAAITAFDPVGRERVRLETNLGGDAINPVLKTYDALGRLDKTDVRVSTFTLPGNDYAYDPLGNVTSLTHTSLTQLSGDTALSYSTSGDLDRVCSIGYSAAAPATCNVSYDAVGNIVSEPRADGSTLSFSYFPGGLVKQIRQGTSTQATYDYDAFGAVQRLTLTSTSSADVRADKHFGGLIYRRNELVNGTTQSVIDRTIPVPGGVATRHGHNASDPWTIAFGEARGTRFTTDQDGVFAQTLSYSPFGRRNGGSGAQPGDAKYTNQQWNGGDLLAAFNLTQLGARLYDPVLGRFLSRDPVFDAGNGFNPYAFAANDPINNSDPSGLCGDGEKDTGGNNSNCIKKDGGSGGYTPSPAGDPGNGATGGDGGSYVGGGNNAPTSPTRGDIFYYPIEQKSSVTDSFQHALYTTGEQIARNRRDQAAFDAAIEPLNRLNEAEIAASRAAAEIEYEQKLLDGDCSYETDTRCQTHSFLEAAHRGLNDGLFVANLGYTPGTALPRGPVGKPYGGPLTDNLPTPIITVDPEAGVAVANFADPRTFDAAYIASATSKPVRFAKFPYGTVIGAAHGEETADGLTGILAAGVTESQFLSGVAQAANRLRTAGVPVRLCVAYVCGGANGNLLQSLNARVGPSGGTIGATGLVLSNGENTGQRVLITPNGSVVRLW